jgi:eukaryotic-like serine/threonine-protein kinase
MKRVVGKRFEIKDPPIGQGGMGVVYRAYDSVTRRYVALKTVWGTVDSNALTLFEKEWSVLARLSHPNIVDIIESGQYEEEGQHRPYFVMPLLPGMTLDQLIKTASQRLTVERTIEILSQTCRGLQAAHDQGLIHRDLKPSNIFVLEDDSVKIIDFGVAHLTDMRTMTTVKGTLQYLAPELLEHKPPSVLSDIFSLGVVAYEALTGRKPFARPTEDEVIEAIRTHIPPPASDLNGSVDQMVSRTVHKAMAKQPWHRFSSAREFGETLRKAYRNEPIEYFDPSKIQPRIERAKKAQSEGDYQFAKEILSELEAEGHIDLQITLLRGQLDQAIRQKTMRQLLESARTRVEQEEYPLALQKLQEVLEIDPQNADALQLRKEVDSRRNAKQVDNWYRLVQQHFDNHLFSQARLGLEEILKLNSGDPKALDLLAQIEKQEREAKRIREEKDQLYQAALKCYQCGEVSTALDKLERLLSLSRQAPVTDKTEKEAQYQNFYNQIRSEHDAYQNAKAEAKRHMADGKFDKALSICSEYLAKNPADPLFRALKIEIEERERQERSAAIAEVGGRVNAEADLDRKMNILKEAAARYPNEPHFKETLNLIGERRNLVNTIVNRARQYEERSQNNEAIGQWDILRNIYPQYPGLEIEIQRLERKRDEQSRDEAKSRLVRQIDSHLEDGEYEKALGVVREALEQFPEDREFAGLEKLAAQGLEKRASAEQFLNEGKRLCASGEVDEGIQKLREAAALDNRHRAIRGALLSALLYQGRALLAQDWSKAKPVLEEALQIDPSHPVARSLLAQAEDHERQQSIDSFVLGARERQTAGDIDGALDQVRAGLEKHANDARLTQLQATLMYSAEVEHRSKAQAAASSGSAHTVVPQASGLAHPSEGATIAEPPPLEAKPATSVPKDWEATVVVAETRVMEPPAITPPPRTPVPPSSGISTPPPLAPAPPPKKKGLSPLQWGAIGAGALVLVAALSVAMLKARRTTPSVVPAGSTVQVFFHADVPANVPVKFTLDGKPVESDQFDSKTGEQHTAEASAEGYRADKQMFTPGASSPFKVEFHLVPALSDLHISSDFKTGNVAIGDSAAGALQGGEFILGELPAGETVLKIIDGPVAFLSLPIKSEAGKPIIPSGPIQVKDCSVVIVSVLGTHARVYASADVKGAPGKNPPQAIPAAGLEVDTVAMGSEFNLNNGRTVLIQPSNTPSLLINVATSESGTLEIDANVPNAKVKIDGSLGKNSMSNGKKILPLRAGKYKVQVIADNFEDSEIRTVQVAKGQTAKEKFELKPVNRKSVLALESAQPGADVIVDDVRAGTVSDSGSIHLDIDPGQHRIMLRKSDFEDSPVITREFKAHEAQTISGTQLPMTRLGSITFAITPANAKITYRNERDAPESARTAENNKKISVRGNSRYFISVTADGYDLHADIVAVEAGKNLPIAWRLVKSGADKPKEVASVQPKDSVMMADPALWVHDDKWWVLKKQEYGWLRARSGTLNVEIEKQSKRILGFAKAKKIEWVIDFQNAGNQVKYTIEGTRFVRQQFVTGKLQPNAARPELENVGESYHLRFEISKTQIVIRDGAGNLIDSVDRPNPNAELGRIGFKGEISIAIH